MEAGLRSRMVVDKISLYPTDPSLFNHSRDTTNPRNIACCNSAILAVDQQLFARISSSPFVLTLEIRHLPFPIRQHPSQACQSNNTLAKPLEMDRPRRSLHNPRHRSPSTTSMETFLLQPDEQSRMDPLPPSSFPRSRQHSPSNMGPKLRGLHSPTDFRAASRSITTSARIPPNSNPQRRHRRT